MESGPPLSFTFDVARPDDAPTLGVLATQVFLDTYATEGVSPALAREALSVYAPEVMRQRLNDPAVTVTMARSGDHVVAFSDVTTGTSCPVPGLDGLEVFRLYVQRGFQRRGLGRALMDEAERHARLSACPWLWLTAWSGNQRALAFYRSLGFDDVGVTSYVIEGQAFENRVLARRVHGPP